MHKIPSTIGIFDSGIGGLAIARAVTKALPHAKIIRVSDKARMPYGDKPPKQVLGFVTPLLQNLAKQGCDAIIVACNTVTTHHITELRKRIAVPLVGIEPMIKPAAALTKTGAIAICATPATLASQRYAWLKATFASKIQVLEPECSQWAYMIEHNQVNEQFIRNQITALCDQQADVIVLGCTHYHWIEVLIKDASRGKAQVIQPEQAVIAQLKRVLAATAPAPRQ